MEAAKELRAASHVHEAAAKESPYRYATPAAAACEAVLRSQLRSAEDTNAFCCLILEFASDGIYGLDADGKIHFANPAANAMTGWEPGELTGHCPHELIYRSHADGSPCPRDQSPILLALYDGQLHQCDSEFFWRKDGTRFAVDYTTTPIRRGDLIIGATLVFRDITSRVRRDASERKRNSIFLAITSNLQIGSTLGMIADAFVELYPRSRFAVHTHAQGVLRLVAQCGLPPATHAALSSVDIDDHAFACARAATLGQSVAMRLPSRAELNPAVGSAQQHVPADGQVLGELAGYGFTACLAVPLLSISGDVLGVVSVFDTLNSATDRDSFTAIESVCDLARLAFEHQRLHAELLRTSQHDQLTGLPDRLLLEDRLEQAIVHGRRHAKQVALCYVDLDHFKEINDTLGHRAGDQLLQQIARLLRRTLREIDTVARQGGDEFILILPELSLESEAVDICARVMTNLQKPFQVGEHTVTVSASIGWSLYPAGGLSASELLQNADIALYAAKRDGRDRIQRYNPTLGAKVQRNIELQRELRHALERNQLHLVYQPLFNLEAQLKGFEALLRWEHPVFGSVGPDQFIALAEESGLIVPIGDWVLYEACLQAREWNALSPTPLKMFVNISGVQLSQETFTSTIAGALARTGLPASLLDLEITETFIIRDTRAASTRLRALRQLGVHISIDDFGCGHSTLSYLQQLPVDSIKIDRSFIACLDGTDKQSAIVRTIVALAEELGLQTVAEGVETGSQFEELQGIQCNLVQGYLLSRPLLPADARLLLNHCFSTLAVNVVASPRPSPALLKQGARQREALHKHQVR